MQLNLSVGLAQNATFINLPLAIFLGRSLVMILLALRQCYLTLDEVTFPVELHCDTRIPFLLNRDK
jgi:hypothetical protein